MNFIKVDESTWMYNYDFSYQYHAEGRIKEINAEYPNVKAYYRTANPLDNKPLFGWKVFIEFKSKADEAEFILRESI